MPKRIKTLIFLGATVSTLILLDKPFFDFRARLSAAVSDSFKKLFPNHDLQEKIKELEKENKNLQLQLLHQTIGTTEKIKIYSSYPFNDKSEILIAAGENKNIKIGDLVTYGEGILVGKVIKVFEEASAVETIFNPDWKMAVRIGERETDAFFSGGNELTLSLISKEAPINPGDIVITASRDLVYGLEAGRIKRAEEMSATPFKKAILEPSFKLSDLKDVKIRKVSH